MAKFPKQLFVVQNDGGDNKYFCSSDTIDEAYDSADGKEPIEIATYERVGTAKVSRKLVVDKEKN